MKKLLSFLLLSNLLYSDSIVVTGDEYLSHDDGEIDLIFAKEYQDEASGALAVERGVFADYEKSYGYEFDDKLRLGILSSHNQIANAFSTQFPFNMQMNYVAGANMVDYMSSTSWLNTILIHESAHNFQLNPKKNRLSKFSHKIFKNVPFTTIGILPVFPVPNALESSFMIEGNAVLNESRFGNGGRLYSGHLLAMAITQAKAGYITPKRTYNSHLYFPYGTHHYIVGGFFQLYLAQKYGIEKTNRYFWNFSGQYLPIQTNYVFKETFGADYEKEIKDYANWLNSTYSLFKPSDGELIATSKGHAKLNNFDDEIFFLTSDGVSRPTLHVIKKGEHQKSSRDFFTGEVFKIGDNYYTKTSKNIAHNRIETGLYDSDARVLKGTESKVIQRVLSDGRFVYFDVKKSFNEPYLYVGDEPYGYVNSSVFSDTSDNIYYFKQSGKKRTLYKNREPLFSYEGWYGFVVDVDKNGVIYFIANSENGSSLYSYDGEIFRASSGDDIVDAKLLDEDSLLLATITADGYEYKKSPLTKTRAEVFNRTFFFETLSSFKSLDKSKAELKDIREYSSYKHMSLSAINHEVIATEDSVDFSLSANFIDPLKQNETRVFISRYDEETLAGVGYSNFVYRLNYGAEVYGVLEKDDTISSRDFGANLFANYPLYKSGRKSVNLDLNYHLDHDRDEREPLSLALSFMEKKKYGVSMYSNELSYLSLFGVYDRDDLTYGAGYNYQKDLTHEFYAGINLKYAKSDTEHISRKYGIEIDDNAIGLHGDPSTLLMPSLDMELYAKEYTKVGLSLRKVLNLDYYSFHIPLSLRREAIYAKYNYYDIDFIDGFSSDFSEYTLGFTFDLLLLHNNPIPFSIEYLYNDNLKDDTRVRVLFDLGL